MALKLPSFHMGAVLKTGLSIAAKFSKQVLERVHYDILGFEILPEVKLIEFMAKTLIDIVLFMGLEPELRKKFGPKWQERIKKAVYCNFLACLHFCVQIEQDPAVFWERTNEYFQNFPLLPGCITMMEILSSSTRGFSVPNTGYNFSFSFRLKETYGYYFDTWGPSVFSKEEWKEIESVGFRSLYFNSPLVTLSNSVLTSLKVVVPNMTSGLIEPLCIGDILITNNSGSYLILKSDGTSAVSIAFGLVYRTKLKNFIVQGIDLHSLCYFNWKGNPDPEIRSMEVEIFLGIPFVQPSLRRVGGTGDGNGPMGPDSPEPTSPQGNGGNEGESSTPTVEGGPQESGPQTPSTEVVATTAENIKQKPTRRVTETVLQAVEGSYPITDTPQDILDTEDSIVTISNGIDTRNWNLVKKGLNSVKQNIIPLTQLGLAAYGASRRAPNYNLDLQNMGGSINVGPATVSYNKSKGTAKPVYKSSSSIK